MTPTTTTASPTTQSAGVDLLPCPFCGGSATSGHYYADDEALSNGDLTPVIFCDDCSIYCEGKNTKQEMIEAWNTRHPL